MFEARYRGYWLVAAGASLFSTKAIFIKLAYRDDLNATLMLAYRMAFSIPFFVAAGLWAWRQKQVRGESPPDMRTLAGAVATGCIGYYLSSFSDFKGLEYISAQLERLVLFTYPIWVLAIGALALGQKITRHAIIAAVVSYSGLAIVFGLDLPEGGQSTVIGTAWVMACAILFAIYQLLAKRFVTWMGSVLFTSVALTSSGVACILHHLIFNGDFSASSFFLWMCFGCAIFATVLPSFLVNAGMARTSPQAVAMISTVSPLVTIVLAVSILGEPFSLADGIGSALVLAGVGYFTWADSRAKAAPAAEALD
ncbi:MAG: DMT family transporter [Rhizobiales bacterium]|nr:DMT family transporter [Hyphomicrobiales bacterium]